MSTHDDHEIEWLEIRDRLPLVELNGVPGQSILSKEVTKNAGMLDGYVLEDEYFHS
jgi:hypothetical protein